MSREESKMEREEREERLLYQGAEAKLFLSTYLGREVVVKERLRKTYRLPELDRKINKQRMLQIIHLLKEVRCNAKCRRAGVLTPAIFDVDLSSLRITFEFIQGVTAKDYIIGTEDRSNLIELGNRIGAAIAKMHETDVVHGDLTTSNMMIADPENSKTVVIIDFGLGMTRPVIEDKAVDLYVLERTLFSTHPGSEYLVEVILEAYRATWTKSGPVLQRLEQVRQRGRKRDMTG